MLAGFGQCLRARSRLQDGVSQAAQIAADPHAEGQSSSATRRVSVPRGWASVGPTARGDGAGDPGQAEGETGAAARFAVHPDVAAILFGDAVDHGEAEAGAFADFLGGKEGFEDLLPHLLADARAGIGDGEFYVFPRRDVGAGGDGSGPEGDIFGGDGKRAAVGHGIAGVDAEVHEDLHDLIRIGLDRPATASRTADFNVFADQPLEHSRRFADHGVQVKPDGADDLLAAEGQHLAGEAGGAPGGFEDLFGIFMQAAIGGKMSCSSSV